MTEAASELIRTRVPPNTCLDLLSSILLSCFLFPYDAVGQKGEKTKLSFHGQVVQEWWISNSLTYYIDKQDSRMTLVHIHYFLVAYFDRDMSNENFVTLQNKR